MLIGIVTDNLAEVSLQRLFSFPDPVNETSARLVAAGVVAQAVLFMAMREWWVLVPLTYGFLARVGTGPRLSPLGQFVTRFATPALEDRLRERNPQFHSRQVPGRPKRFAQSIGLAFTVSASLAWGLGAPGVAVALIGMLALAATLEAAFAICLGCIAYSAIWGCADCDDISDRLRRALVEAREEVDAEHGGATGAGNTAFAFTLAEADAPARR